MYFNIYWIWHIFEYGNGKIVGHYQGCTWVTLNVFDQTILESNRQQSILGVRDAIFSYMVTLFWSLKSHPQHDLWGLWVKIVGREATQWIWWSDSSPTPPKSVNRCLQYQSQDCLAQPGVITCCYCSRDEVIPQMTSVPYQLANGLTSLVM